MPICSTCRRVKFESEQFDSRFVAIGRSANDADEFVEVRERDEVAFERLGAFLGFAQFEARAAQNDFAAMLDVALRLASLSDSSLRPAVIDRQHVDAKELSSAVCL